MTAYPVTLTCWLRPKTSASDATIWGGVGITIGRTAYDIGHLSNNIIRGRGDNDDTADTSTTLADNVWGCAAMTNIIEPKVSAWLNGAGKGTDTVGLEDRFGDLERIMIGRFMRASPVSPFDGDICECTCWNVELSDAHILAIAHGVNPFVIRDAGLKRYYPLWGNESPEEEWKNGNSFTGIVTGAIKSSSHAPVQLLSRYMSGH